MTCLSRTTRCQERPPPFTPLYLFVININILNAYPLFLVVSPGWFVLVILVLLLVS